MADLNGITEMLRRQRRDLDDALEQSQSGETASILRKIEELRQRAEDSRRAFIPAPEPPEAK